MELVPTCFRISWNLWSPLPPLHPALVVPGPDIGEGLACYSIKLVLFPSFQDSLQSRKGQKSSIGLGRGLKVRSGSPRKGTTPQNVGVRGPTTQMFGVLPPAYCYGLRNAPVCQWPCWMPIRVSPPAGTTFGDALEERGWWLPDLGSHCWAFRLIYFEGVRSIILSYLLRSSSHFHMWRQLKALVVGGIKPSKEFQILILGSANVTLQKGLCRCNQVKDLDMRRLFCIVWVGCTCNHKYPYKKKSGYH